MLLGMIMIVAYGMRGVGVITFLYIPKGEGVIAFLVSTKGGHVFL